MEEVDMYSENDWRDYLAHHGIDGQKWGDKNGPPYPLRSDAYSVREKKKASRFYKKALKRSDVDSTKNEPKRDRVSATNEIKYVKKERNESENFRKMFGDEAYDKYERDKIRRIKQMALDRAKNAGLYDMNFLEDVQNKTWASGEGYDKNRMLKEYQKFLEDPSNYRHTLDPDEDY